MGTGPSDILARLLEWVYWYVEAQMEVFDEAQSRFVWFNIWDSLRFTTPVIPNACREMRVLDDVHVGFNVIVFVLSVLYGVVTGDFHHFGFDCWTGN